MTLLHYLNAIILFRFFLHKKFKPGDRKFNRNPWWTILWQTTYFIMIVSCSQRECSAINIASTDISDGLTHLRALLLVSPRVRVVYLPIISSNPRSLISLSLSLDFFYTEILLMNRRQPNFQRQPRRLHLWRSLSDLATYQERAATTYFHVTCSTR